SPSSAISSSTAPTDERGMGTAAAHGVACGPQSTIERERCMADDSVIGKRYPGYEFTIERGKVREFARATMTRNPDYLDDPAAVIPPTWLIASGFWAPDDLENPVASLNIN